MKLIIAYIRPEQLNAVKKSLFSKKIYGLSVTNCLGAGRQKGFTETYRGVVMEVNLLKKIRLEVGLADEKVNEGLDAITAGARTGSEGDGMIFVVNVEKVRRIRTGEEDDSTIS